MPGKKTATITLGGDDYTVHAFNIDELEQLAAILSNDTIPLSTRSFSILKLALLRAEPPVGNVGTIEPDTLDEVISAANAIMELAGLKAAANPPPVEATPAV
jgi:hypothetical protein